DTFTTVDGTVIFNGGATAQPFTSNSKVFESIQIGTAAAGASVTTNDNLTYTGTLLVRNGGSTTFNVTNDVITTAGTLDFSNLDTFTTVDGTVIFNGGATSQAFTGNSLSFESIQVGTGSVGAVVTTPSNFTYTGTFL